MYIVKKKKLSMMQIIGLVLLVAGAVVLIWGAYNLISFNTSAGGKFANKAAGLFGSQTEAVRNSIIQMVIGAAAGVVGFFIYKKK
jgi:drug/metabolite transporter (DMT)-like permease